MATTAVLVPVEQYLDTMYRPDREYLDGELLEKNATEKPRARATDPELGVPGEHEGMAC